MRIADPLQTQLDNWVDQCRDAVSFEIQAVEGSPTGRRMVFTLIALTTANNRFQQTIPAALAALMAYGTLFPGEWDITTELVETDEWSRTGMIRLVRGGVPVGDVEIYFPSASIPADAKRQVTYGFKSTMAPLPPHLKLGPGETEDAIKVPPGWTKPS